MRKTTILTDCGHRWKTGRRAADVADHTQDCRVCGRLLIYPRESVHPTYVVLRARDFHAYLHEGNPDWPADGAGTGYVEFAP